MNTTIKTLFILALLASLGILVIGARSVVSFLFSGSDGGTTVLLIGVVFFLLWLFQPRRGGR